MSKKSFMQFNLHLHNGEIGQALQMLSSEEVTLNEVQALKVVLYCCAACNNKELESQIKAEELAVLLLQCQKHIKDLMNDDLLKYLQSIFHILKFFMVTENYETIIKLRKTFVPSFKENITVSKHAPIYNSSCVQIHNWILEQTRNLTKVIPKFFAGLSFLVIDMFKVLLPMKALVETRAYHYFKYLSFLSAEEQVENYKKLLHICKYCGENSRVELNDENKNSTNVNSGKSTSCNPNKDLHFNKNTKVNRKSNFNNTTNLNSDNISINSNIGDSQVCPSVLQILNLLVVNFCKQNEHEQIKNIIDYTINFIDPKNQSKLNILNILPSISNLLFTTDYPQKSILAGQLNQYYKDIKNDFEKNQFSEWLQGTCLVVNSLLLCLLHQYKDVGNKNDTDIKSINDKKRKDKNETIESKTLETKLTYLMEPDIHLKLYKLIGTVSRLISQIEFVCPCKSCGISTKIETSISTCLMVAHFAKEAHSKNQPCTALMMKAVHQHFEQCCLYLKHLKKKNCPRWKALWHETGRMMYTFGLALLKNNNQDCVQLFKQFSQNLISLEGTGPSLIRPDILNGSLINLTEFYLKTEDFYNGMVIAALNICLCEEPKEKNFAFLQWCKLKRLSKESNIGNSKEHQKHQNDEMLKEDIQFHEDHQEETLVSIIQANSIMITSFYPNLTIDKEVSIKLLCYELRQYRKVWASKVSIMSAFRSLSKLLDNSELVKIIVEEFCDPTSVHEQVSGIIFEAMNTFESYVVNDTNNTSKNSKYENNYKDYLYLACLNCIYFNVSMCVTRQKSLQAIKSQSNMVKTSTQPDEEPQNPDDECNIVTSYDHLRLDFHAQIIKYLNRALEILDNVLSEKGLKQTEILKERKISSKTSKNSKCSKNINISIECAADPDYITTLKELQIYNVSTVMAQEFHLHCFTLESLRSWILSFKIARILNEPEKIIETICYIVGLSDAKSSHISKLISEADDLLSNCLTNVENYFILGMYYSHKSMYHYRLNEIEEGHAALEQGKIYMNKMDTNTKEFLKIKLDYVQCHYLLLPCSYKIEGHDSKIFAAPSELLKCLCDYYKTKDSTSPYVLTTIFDINDMFANTYRNLRLPRDLRCFCRELAVLAQQLALPLRSANLLIYLGQADAFNCRLNDCQVKIDGLSYILCMQSKTNEQVDVERQSKLVVNSSNFIMDELTIGVDKLHLDNDQSNGGKLNILSPCNMKQNPDNNHGEKLNLGNKLHPMNKMDLSSKLDFDNFKFSIDDLARDFQEVLLDCTTAYKKHQSTSGSPVLQSQPFAMPSFIYHNPSCMCYQCMSLEFQDLVLGKIYLQIQLNTLEQDNGLVHTLLNGAIRIYFSIKAKKEAFKQKICNLLTMSLFKDVDDYLHNTVGLIFLNLGNTLMRMGNNTAAKKINERLLALIESVDGRNFHLFIEAYDQKVNISLATNQYYLKIKEPVTKKNTSVKEEKPSEALQRTPENKQSTVIVEKLHSPDMILPDKKVPRCIKFNLSDMEDNEETCKQSRYGVGYSQTKSTSKSKVSTAKASTSKASTSKASTLKATASKAVTSKQIVPKIKIYTPAEDKVTRSKRTATLKGPIAALSKSEDTSDENFLVPMSPDAITKSRKKTVAPKETDLRIKTKLLTDKLKNSAVKNTPQAIGDESCEDIGDLLKTYSNRRRNTVRKNLMSEMSKPSETLAPKAKGVTRKSTKTNNK